MIIKYTRNRSNKMGVEILDGILRRYVGRDLKGYGRNGTRLAEPRDQR